MNRGEVYEYTLGNTILRVAILSIPAFNPRRATFAVVLGAGVPAPPATIAVAMGAADPVRGTLDVSRLRPLSPDAVGARLGKLSRTTMERTDDALRTYLGLA